MLSKEEEKEEIKSPGMNVQAVIASGSMMSMMLKDIQNLEVDGPRIPDPEPMRLMMHAKNSENKSVYSIIPTIEDEEWADWEGRWAHNQAKVMNLLSTLTRSRRYSKNRIKAASRVQKAENINSELGAAAASCASWWMESQRGIPREMMEERDIRFASRVRGALADLRNRRVDDSDSSDLVLLVPVHQAHLVQFANAIKKCETIEKIEME
jgi:hypothetical protein